MRLFTMDWLRYGAARPWDKATAQVAAAILLAFALMAPLGAAAESAAPNELSVMTFGDSLTAGYGLTRDDGFVAQLSVWLRKHGTPDGVPVRLLNGSVSGSTTAGGVRRLDWSLGENPDALIVELGGNDLLRGVDPKETRANLEKILSAAKARHIEVLLVGLVAKDNYGPDYRTAFNAIYPDLAKEYGTLLERDFFTALPADDAVRVPYLQEGGVHPNAEGVAMIVDQIGPKVQELIARTLADRAAAE